MRTAIGERGTGELRFQDQRDRAYPVAALRPVSGVETRGWRYWWNHGWFGDQQTTPHCVEYAWWHAFIDGPKTAGIQGHDVYEPLHPNPWLYCEAQKRDPWEGDCSNPKYDGSSVRAGAKALQTEGLLDEYRWAHNLDEVIRSILTIGPVVVGTVWHESMSFPDSRGFLVPQGTADYAHAYVLNGVNVEREVFRIKNSWSAAWGDNAHAWITFENFEKLLRDYAELCVPLWSEAE